MFSSELISQIKSAKASLVEKFRNVHYEMCAAEFKKANQYNEGKPIFMTIIFWINYEQELRCSVSPVAGRIERRERGRRSVLQR